MILGGKGACLCLVGVLSASCAISKPRPVSYSDTPRASSDTNYAEIHKAWTRHIKLVKDIGLVFEGWATLKGREFRHAYVAKYAAVYGLPADEQEALLRGQDSSLQAAYEFHLVAQSTSDQWNDLERRTTAWRISLVDGTGAELSPTSIKVEKLPAIYEDVFFPNRTLFSRSYTVKFAKPDPDDPFVGPPSGRMVLRVASPLGRIEFAWDML